MSTDRLASLVEEILIGIPPIKNHFFFSLEKAWMVFMKELFSYSSDLDKSSFESEEKIDEFSGVIIKSAFA